MISRTRVLDAVLIKELAVLEAGQEVLFVFGIVAVGEGALYAAARRCVVACHGESYQAVVGELNLLLHQSLAKRASAHDGGSVVVLHGTRENLACRCRVLVDEHHKGHVLVRAVTIRAVILARRFATLGVNNELILGQELVGHLHGALQVSARVVAQVDDKVLEALLLQFGQSHEQFGIGGFAKLGYLDVACGVVHHVRGGDGFLWNLAARDGEVASLGLTVAQHAYFNLRVLGSLEFMHGLLVGNHLAHKRFAVHAYNLVAGKHARLFGRTVLDNVHHVNGVLAYVELNADARERALQVVVGCLHILRAHVGGVWVELG